jgi:hypothetical protein
MQDKLHGASRYIVDTYFAINSFAVGVQAMEFELIRRFRDEAVLFYPTLEKPTGKWKVVTLSMFGDMICLIILKKYLKFNKIYFN